MNFKNIICGITAAFMLTGCAESFLDTDNLTGKDESIFPKSVSDMEEIIVSIYRPVMGDSDNPQNNPLFIAELMSDERLGAAGKDDALAQSIANYKKTNDNMYSGFWSRMYQGIYRCNYLMSVIDNIKWEGQEETRSRILGEAYYMRGYYYYDLARFFENVPLTLSCEPLNLPQAPVDELFGQIASDFVTAAELLPANPHAALNGVGTDGHATRWAAEAMLARMYLYYSGVYGKDELTLPGDEGKTLKKADVVTYLEDCIKNSGHDLTPKFGDLWAYSAAGDYAINQKYGYNWLGDCAGWKGWRLNESDEYTPGYRDNPEVLFAHKHAYGQQYYGRNLTVLFFSPRYQDADNPNSDGDGWGGVYPFGTGWGGGTVTYDILKTWPDGDERKEASILDVDAEGMKYHDNGGHQVEDTHLFNKKYIAVNVHTNEMESKDKDNGPGAIALYWYMYPGIHSSDNDYMSCNFMDEFAIRFSDVLLMHSELTNTTTGIDRVRARVGLPSIGCGLDAIKQERRHELAFEGVRFFDLKRWGDLETAVNAHRSNLQVRCDGNFRTISVPYRAITKGLLPIPDDEIRKSGGTLKQNPGWGTNEGNYVGPY